MLCSDEKHTQVYRTASRVCLIISHRSLWFSQNKLFIINLKNALDKSLHHTYNTSCALNDWV